MGGQFALDRARVEGSDNLVLLLEPGTGERLEIPATVRLFHDTEVVDFADPVLSVSFYAEWRTSTGDDRPIDGPVRLARVVVMAALEACRRR